MTVFGVTDAGFVPMRQTDAFDEIANKLRNLFGGQIDLSAESVEGNVDGIVAERVAKINEALEVLAGVLDDGQASGTLLDALCALTLTFRRGATFSVVPLVLAGDDATAIPSGRLLSNGQPEFQFQTISDATLVAADAWEAETEYDEGDRIVTGGHVYQSLNAGTSGVDSPPIHTARPISLSSPLVLEFETIIADGDIVWLWLGEGDAAADVQGKAAVSGPVFVASLGLDTIDTPVSGWTGVVNLEDVTTGVVVQADEALRIQRVVELAALGTSPPDALRGRLLRVGVDTVNPVTACTIFRNVNDTTDDDGIPPHAIEAMLRGGEDDDIRAAIWAAHACGPKTHGNVAGFITDSEGNEQSVKFSRPTELDIYVDVELEKNPLLYPADGDDQVKAAIVAYGTAQQAARNGANVVAWSLGAALKDIPGILDVTLVEIGTAPAPSSSATIAVNLRQIAIFDTGRIAVVSTDGDL